MDQFNIEAWILFSIGIVVTIVRTYARVTSAGFKALQADDFLVWIGLLFYAILTAVLFCFYDLAHGTANDGISNEYRASLHEDDPEYQQRVNGSVMQIIGWLSYSVSLWALKSSLLVVYQRLTASWGHMFSIGIYIGFAFITTSWIAATMNLFLACRPFERYWQIYPDPGNLCQPAVSRQLIWVYLSFNVATNLYLIIMLFLLLWSNSYNLQRKVGVSLLLCLGALVVVCGILRGVLVINGVDLGNSWAIREVFVAIVAINIPPIAPLLEQWLAQPPRHLFASMCWASKLDHEMTGRDQASNSGMAHRNTRNLTKHGPAMRNEISKITSRRDSEEQMIGKVKTQTKGTWDTWNGDNARRFSRSDLRIQKTVRVSEVQRVDTYVLPGEEEIGGGQMGNFSFARGPVRTSYHPRE